MKAYLNIALSLFFFCLSFLVQSQDVRNATWGMTMKEVIESEGREPDEVYKDLIGRKNGVNQYSGKIKIRYDIAINRLNVILIYTFEANALTSASMAFETSDWLKDKSFSTRMNQLLDGLTYMEEKGLAVGNQWSVGYKKTIDFPNGFFNGIYQNFEKLAEWVENHNDLGNYSSLVSNAENSRTFFEVSYPIKKVQPDIYDKYIGYFTYKAKDFKANQY